ncbi:MAG: hypothetical protein ACTSO7_15965 [Candidatus Heimdallarchaeota archaeon]
MHTIQPFNKDNLEETGRLKIFFHCPESKLPIRNVLNQKNGNKTEPHIEIGAENYWNSCYQKNNVKPFAYSKRKYLFLFTYCKNKKLSNIPKGPLIIGYIIKKKVGISPERKKSVCYPSGKEPNTYVKGDIYIFDFKDALPLHILGIKNVRLIRVEEEITSKILNHFKGKKNIKNACVKEIKRLDPNNKTCYKMKCGYSCKFEEKCLRWN